MPLINRSSWNSVDMLTSFCEYKMPEHRDDIPKGVCPLWAGMASSKMWEQVEGSQWRVESQVTNRSKTRHDGGFLFDDLKRSFGLDTSQILAKDLSNQQPPWTPTLVRLSTPVSHAFSQLDRLTVMSTLDESQSSLPLVFLAIRSPKPHHALRTDNANHVGGAMVRSEAPVGTREQPCRCATCLIRHHVVT